MDKILLTAAFVAIGASSASAADLAARPYTKAAPIVAAAYDWSGFYIGANGGWASSRKCWDLTEVLDFGVRTPVVPADPEGCHDARGGTAGGQAGYRWQSAAFVFGLEAQGNWANLTGSSNSLPSAFGDFVRNHTRVDAFGLFTGQIGYAWNNALLYVKGGAAVVRDKYEGFNTLDGTVFDTARETRWGGVVGVGLEYGFTPNWSVAVEYDHLFMGSKDVVFLGTGAAVGVAPGAYFRTDRIGQDVDMVTARVNYRFGGPVVARY